MDNLFAAIPDQLPDELVTVILQQPTLRIERIVSRGHCSAPGFWYQQQQHEWVLLVQGAARLRLENQPTPVSMEAGDYLLIPAELRHRLEWTSPASDCIWLCLFFSDSQ